MLNRVKYSFQYLYKINLKLLSSENITAPFIKKYSPDEENIILERLNTCENNDITTLAISEQRLKKIVAYRKKYGRYTSLHQILAVEGLSTKILKSLCDSVLDPTLVNELNAKRSKNISFVIPELPSKKMEEMSNVVGIVLGPLSLNWAGLTVGKESHSVYSWGHHTLNLSPDIKKHHETQILQAAYEAVENLPEADTYILESMQMSAMTQQPSANQVKTQLTAMMLVLLNQPTRERGEPGCVWFQRRWLWCRLYGTLIGGERVSAEKIVDEMLSGVPGPYSPLIVPSPVLDDFQKESPLIKDGLSSALLLTTSFLDVNLKKLPQCLKLLRGSSRKAKA